MALEMGIILRKYKFRFLRRLRGSLFREHGGKLGVAGEQKDEVSKGDSNIPENKVGVLTLAFCRRMTS